MDKISESTIERDRKYAWDYFQLHSSQRIASFNFFITIATAVVVGISTVLQPTIKLSELAIVLGVILTVFSFIFWKLDQRNKMLIHTSEDALKKIEEVLEASFPHVPSTSLFKYDEKKVRELRASKTLLFWKRHFSYSDCFNLVFVIFGLLGVLGAVLGILQQSTP